MFCAFFRFVTLRKKHVTYIKELYVSYIHVRDVHVLLS